MVNNIIYKFHGVFIEKNMKYRLIKSLLSMKAKLIAELNNITYSYITQNHNTIISSTECT